MAFAIRLESVSKKYILGAGAHKSWTFTDDVAARFARLWRKQEKRPTREELWALRDVSLEIEEGEALAIIGRNGAGKSTALKIMSRITLPTSGRALVRGRVGSLLEVGTGFHPELTGRENVFLNGAILGMSRLETARKFDEIVGFAGLGKFIDTPIKRYSSGMHMRLAFSVAAHLEPEIMLIDEVLAVGDQEFQNRCFGRIDEIEKEGRTVVFISHNMGAVRRLCRRGVLLNDGHLVADGPTDGVMESYYTMISATQPVEGMEVEGDGDGTGDHALLSWSLSSPADLGAYTVPAGSPCEFRFRVRLSKAVPHGYMMLAIYSHDGILISRHTSMDAQEIFWHFEPGVHEATFALPFFPLSPGRYEPLLILGNRDGETVESWHPRPEFQVVGQGEPASEMDREGGLIVLPSEFSIQPLEPR